MTESFETSLEITGSSPAPRRGGARLRGGIRSPAPRHEGSRRHAVEDAAPSSPAHAPEEEGRRHPGLYDKWMMLYFLLASPEEQRQMAEPIGWRPELPSDISLEHEIRIVQGRVDAMLGPSAPPSATPSAP